MGAVPARAGGGPMGEVRAVYADGGTLGKNPCRHGGMWAYRHVGPDDALVAEDSGVIFPADVGLPTVTNTVAELWAVVRALEALPKGWRGDVFTDSQVTVYRIARPAKAQWRGVPDHLIQRAYTAIRRLGRLQARLLAGHPTAEDLARGHAQDGRPVSPHNVACDDACNAHAALYWRVRPVGSA